MKSINTWLDIYCGHHFAKGKNFQRIQRPLPRLEVTCRIEAELEFG